MLTPQLHPSLTRSNAKLTAFSLIGQDGQYLISLAHVLDLPAEVRQQLDQQFEHSNFANAQHFYSAFQQLPALLSAYQGQATAIFFSADQTALLLAWQGSVWLKRANKVVRILTADHEVKVLEGSIEQDDLYLVATETDILTDKFLSTQFDKARLLEQLQTMSGQQPFGYGVIEVVQQQESDLTQDTSEVVPHKSKILMHHRKKIFLTVVCLTILIAGVMAWRGWQTSQTSKAETMLQPFYLQLQEVQQKAEENSLQARDELAELQDQWVNQKENLPSNRWQRQQNDQFEKQLQQFAKQLSDQVELETLPVFFDFRLVQSDLIASQASLDENTAVFLDVDKRVVVALNLDTKQHSILSIGQHDQLRAVSLQADQLFILGKGIYQFPLSSQVPAEQIVTEGDSNRESKFLGSFDDYIYVFNPEERNIFRYLLEDDGALVSQPVGWFQDKKNLDFAEITSMAINGSVWLGTQNGEILQYDRGEPLSFNISGLDKPFSSTLKIFTKPDYNYLYVLEAAQQRVVVLDKQGQVVKQVSSPSLAAASDIVASEDRSMIYVVAGSLVYLLSL